MSIRNMIQMIESIEPLQLYGKVQSIQGLTITVRSGLKGISIGSLCAIHKMDGSILEGEVVGIQSAHLLVMPYGPLTEIGLDSLVQIQPGLPVIYPHHEWVGRVLNAMGTPVDDKGPLPLGSCPSYLKNAPPSAASRKRIGAPLSTGIRAIDTFLTCCQGQRLGIFSGSGVGKSSLLSMLTRFTNYDIAVIGLIGERGREVRDFIEDTLGEEGLKRCVVVASTSDEAPLLRRRAAYLTLAIAESFRDQGKSVLCVMDSVTRFAMAQREIGLSAGEPPTSKGYTPSVFTELAHLLERAGPGAEGFMTAYFTVLVDGDDTNEPISDAVRGIVDGHFILDRALANRGHFPSINILKSVSRMVPQCHTPEQSACVKSARRSLSTYEDMADMIRIGAYRSGSHPLLDEAIKKQPALEAFLQQDLREHTEPEIAFQQLQAIMSDG